MLVIALLVVVAVCTGHLFGVLPRWVISVLLLSPVAHILRFKGLL
ncbi:hypothetical protein [Paraburkholderia sp. RL17-373-BIF-A]